MYTMVLDDLIYTGADRRWLYYPGDDEYVVDNFSITMSLEEVATAEFKIYPGHPYYNPATDPIEPRKSMVTIYRNDEVFLYGQVRDVKLEIDGSKTVYVVDELAFLLDTIQPQFSVKGQNNAYVLNDMLERHNALVQADRQFDFGHVSGPGDPWFQSTYIISSNYEKTLDIIRNQMSTYTIREMNPWSGDVEPGVYQQYVKVRRLDPYSVGSPKRIDVFNFYTSQYVETVQQDIRLRKNIISFTQDRNGEDFFTAVIPLGARKNTEDVPGLEGRVDIRSVNGGKRYIQSDAAVAQYGFVCEVVDFDDVTSPSDLLRMGRTYLNKHLSPVETMELSVFDLSLTDPSLDSFDVGKRVRVFSVTNQGIETGTAEDYEIYGIVGMNINPLEPANNTITLSKGILAE